MTAAASLSFEGDCMRVEGTLDFATVIPLETQGKAWLREQAPAVCRLDLGAVANCNSAATALVLSWLRTAHAVGKKLSIENVPESLRGQMQLASLDDILSAG